MSTSSTATPVTDPFLDLCPYNLTHTQEQKSDVCTRHPHPCCRPLPPGLATVNGVLTSLLAGLGSLGNLASSLVILYTVNIHTSSWSSLLTTDFPSLLLLNLSIFDFLFCCVVMPQQATAYFSNMMPFSRVHCQLLGFTEKLIMYGQRAALAMIAINATNILQPGDTGALVTREAKLLVPWALGLLYTLPIVTEMLPSVRMEYHVQLGQCTISNIEAAIIIEILGTYLPFLIIVWSYWKSQEMACSRSRYLSDVDATAG